MVMMRLLSTDMEPKPATTERVGKKWAMPHMIGSNDPIQSKTVFAMSASWPSDF
jgi:hypothetical protein